MGIRFVLYSAGLLVVLAGCTHSESELIIAADDYCGVNAPIAGTDFDRKAGLSPWGWAFDRSSGKVIEKISIQIISDDNKIGITAPLTRSSRPDVAKAFGRPELENSGFIGSIDVNSLPAGVYRVSIVQRDAAKTYVCTSPSKITLS
jgi:hypothetical protein